MKTEIAIIGGGMVGLAQGVALAQAGVEVVVVDRENPQTILQAEFDGRTSAIAWKSVQLLKQIGAWGFMEPHAQPINDIRVSDSDSLMFTHFDHTEIGKEPFGYIIENRHIRAALYKRAEQIELLQLLAPCEVKQFDFAAKKLVLSEQELEYQLLIAADGKFSATRKAAGIEVDVRDYKQSGIVCTIEHELPHGGLAHEKFLPAGPFAVLPMLGNRSSLVWTEPTELTPIFMQMSDAEFLAEIEKRCDYLGKIRLVNVGQKNRWSYPLSLSHARTYIAQAPHGLRGTLRGAQSRLPSPDKSGSETFSPSIVLIGDAAHSIHPIAGQGVNLGFRDVIDLTEMIVEKRKLGLPMSIVLAEYEKKRRLDNSLMIFATDTLNRLFSNNITPIRWARDLGLGLVNEIAPLKKFFMKAASGKL